MIALACGCTVEDSEVARFREDGSEEAWSGIVGQIARDYATVFCETCRSWQTFVSEQTVIA